MFIISTIGNGQNIKLMTSWGEIPSIRSLEALVNLIAIDFN